MAQARVRRSVKPRAASTSALRRWLSGITIALLVILSATVFVSATYGPSAKAQTTGTDLSNVMSAVASLQANVASLQQDIATLRTNGGGTVSDAARVDNGVSECLVACQSTLIQCFANQKPSSSVAVAKTTGLDSCRTSANTCINKCQPKPTPAVSCQDRCAVVLGACVMDAGNDPQKLGACQTNERTCLVAACQPNTHDTNAANRITAAQCRDQCARNVDICKHVANFNSVKMQTCDLVGAACLQNVCAGWIQSALPSASNSGAKPQGQQTTVKCEDACTATFKSCRASAKNDSSQSACNSSYGDCRAACLTKIGGSAFSTTP